MQPLSTISSYDLTWVKPSWRKQLFELRDGTTVVASLALGTWMTKATGTLADRTFLIKRTGFWRTSTLILPEGSAEPIATYASEWSGRRGTLTFADGQMFRRDQSGFWRHTAIWTDANGQTILQHALALSDKTSITLDASVLSRPETGIIILLSEFLTSVANNEAASAAATTVATGG